MNYLLEAGVSGVCDWGGCWVLRHPVPLSWSGQQESLVTPAVGPSPPWPVLTTPPDAPSLLQASTKAENRAQESKDQASADQQSGVSGLVADAKNKVSEMGNRAQESAQESRHNAQERATQATNRADENLRKA